MGIGIKSIEYALPKKVLTNEELALIYEDWTAEKILAKTGIASRHVVLDNECASDLAEIAAKSFLNLVWFCRMKSISSCWQHKVRIINCLQQRVYCRIN